MNVQSVYLLFHIQLINSPCSYDVLAYSFWDQKVSVVLRVETVLYRCVNGRGCHLGCTQTELQGGMDISVNLMRYQRQNIASQIV